MKDEEALKLALEALELHGQQYPHMVKGYCLDAITAIKEALAQPEHEWLRGECVKCGQSIERQEPVGRFAEFTDGIWREVTDGSAGQPLYTAPPVLMAQDKQPIIENYPEKDNREPVAWGVDWGRAGDIPCVSIIKRLPDGGIEVMAVEYAPYSYTTPPQEQQSCDRRTWVGLTDDEIKALASWWPSYDQMPALMVLAKDIQNSLKERNHG